MNARILRMLGFLLSVTALCWGAVPSLAQTTKNPNPQIKNSAQASTQPNNTALTPIPGKMRGTSNEMRKAAAIRNADRKAKAPKKGGDTSPTAEVKQ